MACCDNCADTKLLPNTVRAPGTPLYQLGWMGDDSFDFWDPIAPQQPTIDATLTFPPPSADPSFSDMLSNPNAYPDIFTPTNPSSGVVYGPPGPGQPGGVPIAAASSIASLFSKLFGGSSSSGVNLPPGPSPRVGVPSGSTMSMASALPLLAVVGVGIVLLSSVGGKRR